VEFIIFYPDLTDAQRIAWIGTLLSGTALDWHQHRQRTTGDRDTWALYATHLQAEYCDRQEGANAQPRLGELEYKGDIKAYLTEFWAPNIYARCTGESLQEKINLAMPRTIIDMRFAHHMGYFVDDEHFLTVIYEAGVHVEQQNALEELQGRKKEAGQKDTPGKDSGKGRKGQGQKEGPMRSEKADSGGKTERSGFGQPGHWKAKEEALTGVRIRERKEYGSSKDNCWRGGRAGHKTFECCTGTTTGGTALPTAHWQGASSAKHKRDDDKNVETPAPKQSKVTTIKTEDDDMRDATAAWAKTGSPSGTTTMKTWIFERPGTAATRSLLNRMRRRKEKGGLPRTRQPQEKGTLMWNTPLGRYDPAMGRKRRSGPGALRHRVLGSAY